MSDKHDHTDAAAQASGDLYKRLPQGDSLGGTPTQHAAETLAPGEVPDWGVDGGADGD
ncbi:MULTISPECIES: hypothetical protein [unclassified Salinibacterium]|uniref:hypothetical protein n=1 Tax=unclassified Salinibacterium TaxID=2632331 RepID=UPI00143D586F|nr:MULTISPECIES: hypothetical protein [unclassified Salinibacterium]